MSVFSIRLQSNGLASVKPHLQRLLGRIGVYERAKASWIYDLYWRFADRTIIDHRQREVEFYKDLLRGFRKGDLILDVGANHGYKSDIFLRLGARVIAVEPDEKSQRVLKQKFLNCRIKQKPVIIIGKALSDRSSVEKLWIDEPGSAKNTLSRKWAEILRNDDKRFGQRLSFDGCKTIETIPMKELLDAHGLPFFVKIDVEGHELEVLRGMNRPVPYLSYEVNLPEFRAEGIACVQTLQRLAPEGEFNYTSDCQDGLVLKKWCRASEFSVLLDSCKDSSIEVFWRTPNVEARRGDIPQAHFQHA
jgi:FkbM family methyltransferase